MRDQLVRLFAHARWADELMLDRLAAIPEPPAGVLREMAHIVGAGETWLSRLERRAARVQVWPELTLAESRVLALSVHDGLAARLDSLDEKSLKAVVSYANSAGQPFETATDDILLQLATHGQYHRGKINQRLRDAGLDPVPVDYIVFVRGLPATTRTG
jgi:uncharacterized damage-inducible protein DinB